MQVAFAPWLTLWLLSTHVFGGTPRTKRISTWSRKVADVFFFFFLLSSQIYWDAFLLLQWGQQLTVAWKMFMEKKVVMVVSGFLKLYDCNWSEQERVVLEANCTRYFWVQTNRERVVVWYYAPPVNALNVTCDIITVLYLIQTYLCPCWKEKC